jgi:hypothetical protein
MIDTGPKRPWGCVEPVSFVVSRLTAHAVVRPQAVVSDAVFIFGLHVVLPSLVVSNLKPQYSCAMVYLASSSILFVDHGEPKILVASQKSNADPSLLFYTRMSLQFTVLNIALKYQWHSK